MKHIERFLATVERRPVDRPAAWLGLPTGEATPGLLNYFGAANIAAVKTIMDDDIWPIEVPYHCPPANYIACAFDFAKKNQAGYAERTLTAPGFFEDIEDPARIDEFRWPNPSAHIDPGECRKIVKTLPPEYAVMGIMWSAHFQDACAAFGMETALMRMIQSPELFRAVIDRITEFYLQANEIFYESCGKSMHAVLLGNDFGSQTALMVSPDLLRRFVFPGTRRLVAQAKAYGYKVVYHSCGAIRDIIPDLIALGVDVIHPVQALAAGMNPVGLKKDFGDKISFCGGVDAQNLLVHGTPEQVYAKVMEIRSIFPTGLIISPSHEAILPDIPLGNIKALFEACAKI